MTKVNLTYPERLTVPFDSIPDNGFFQYSRKVFKKRNSDMATLLDSEYGESRFTTTCPVYPISELRIEIISYGQD